MKIEIGKEKPANFKEMWPGELEFFSHFDCAAVVPNVLFDILPDDAAARRDEILQATYYLCGKNNPIKRYQGEEL